MATTSLNQKKGQAMIITVVFFLVITLIMVIGIINPILDEMKIAGNLIISKGTYYASEAGIEDVVYRLKQGQAVSVAETLTVNGYTASTTVTDIFGGKQVDAMGTQNELYRKSRTTLSVGSGAAFFYGVQVGTGGIELNNSSSVGGSVYSNGPITGTNNVIKGDAVSAGASGRVSGIHATGSAYAHTIENSTVDKNAYYTTITGSTVGGTSFSGSSDQEPTEMPISEEQIEEWKNDALAGGVINSPCPYVVDSNITLGPKKINCDLDITGGVITLNGPIWVAGNIEISNTAEVRIGVVLGNTSVALVADNPLNRTSGSTIELANSVAFFGSGSSNSHVLMISQNNSAESGGSNTAISISNTANGDLLLYAPHGLIQLANSVSLKEVTGYKIRMNNSAEVIYRTGLASLLFSAGPGGGYTILSWKEVE